MQAVVPSLLLLHEDPVLRAMLEEMPGLPFRLVPLSGWDALLREVRRAPAGAVAVVDPRPGGPAGGDPAGAFRALDGAFPSLPVVAALDVEPADAHRVLELLAWGVADVLPMNLESTPAAVLRRLKQVQGRRMEALLRRALPRRVPGRTGALLARAAAVVAAGGGAPELAAALGIAERTVVRWCERADLPPPRRLLAWLRLLLAADLLEDRGRSITAVARACGYASDGSLKGAFVKFVGAPPGALRERGAFEVVSRSFADELFALRESSRERGRPERVWLR